MEWEAYPPFWIATQTRASLFWNVAILIFAPPNAEKDLISFTYASRCPLPGSCLMTLVAKQVFINLIDNLKPK